MAKPARRRSRSYSGSAAVGDGNAEQNLWDGSYYRHVLKTSELLIPGPASTFVFTEAARFSINDPSLVLPLTNRWIDLPGSFHDGAANFTFGDGHAEMHKWTDSSTTQKVRYSGYYGSALTKLVDLAWVRTHASRQTK